MKLQTWVDTQLSHDWDIENPEKSIHSFIQQICTVECIGTKSLFLSVLSAPKELPIYYEIKQVLKYSAINTMVYKSISAFLYVNKGTWPGFRGLASRGGYVFKDKQEWASQRKWGVQEILQS